MSFRIAEKLALQSPFLKHRVGCVILKGKRVLSTGFNSIRYNRETRLSTLHSEAAAITKMVKAKRLSELVGATMYVTRYTKAGTISCAKPCPTCMELIQAVGIKKVYYTDFDGSTKVIKL